MISEFEKDRNKEQEFYAHINVFKLLLICQLSNGDDNIFNLMGGKERLNRLVKDIKEEKIYLENKILELYVQMTKLKDELSCITFGKSLMLEQAILQYDMLGKSYLSSQDSAIKPYFSETDYLGSALQRGLSKDTYYFSVSTINEEEKGYQKSIGER